jgi:Fanconi anemia group J protein
MASKKHVMVEPTRGGQEEFEAAKAEYKDAVATLGGCVLMAVYRGKMSEGISFNDNFARGVICVGLPLPNVKDRSIVAKRAYNDEQRSMHKRTDLLSGDAWYKQQAYRALAQALGRCIRHSADYGVVVLMDDRHCDDGTSYRGNDGLSDAHRNLPKWMRQHVKNLDCSSPNTYSVRSKLLFIICDQGVHLRYLG